MDKTDLEEPWFSGGLRFKCTGCGACCTGSPGYVYLSDSDLTRLSSHFKMDPKEFVKKNTRLVEGQLALIDRPGSGDCIFLKDRKCSAYEARPTQCRTFPWWIHNLRNSKDWEEAASRCEGIDHPEAPVVPASFIQEECLTYLDNLLEENFSNL